MTKEKVSDLFPPPTIEAWADSITQAWRETVSGIIQVGRLLIAARKALKDQRGAWSRLINHHGLKESQVLPFSAATAGMLINIAEDTRLPTVVGKLPPSWRTLYVLTQLTDKEFKSALDDGRIHPEMKRSDVRPKRENCGPELEMETTDADEAIRIIAKYLNTLIFDPTPDVRAREKEAMKRASAENIKVIATAAEFLTELMESVR